MPFPRPDLNGCRLKVAGEPSIWLVFHGQRHLISGRSVESAIFSTSSHPLEVDSVDEILRGFDLVEGSCLVQPDNAADVFFVTGFPASEVRRYHIGSYEAFLAFGFATSAIKRAPDLVVLGLQAGAPLSHAETPNLLDTVNAEYASQS